MLKASIIIAAALVIAPGYAHAKGAKGVGPIGDLTGLITPEDYPQEALALDQQGTATVRLRVGTDGGVKDCRVIGSSGSSALDETTCRIMTERARFTPARDRRGRVAEGSFLQRITWRIAEPGPGSKQVEVRSQLWMMCIGGEVAKAIPRDAVAESVWTEALAACDPLEQALVAEMRRWDDPDRQPDLVLPILKRRAHETLVKVVAGMRADLAAETGPTPQPTPEKK